MFSGFYSQKGESLLLSAVGLGRFWVLVNLFTGLVRRAFEDGNYRRINPQWRARVELLLDALDAAEKVEDLNLLTLGTHLLKGNRKGEWGMTVTKNWRITFRFEAGDAVEVDLEDHH